MLLSSVWLNKLWWVTGKWWRTEKIYYPQKCWTCWHLMRGREVTSGGLSDLLVSGSLWLQSELAALAARHAACHVTQDGDWAKKRCEKWWKNPLRTTDGGPAQMHRGGRRWGLIVFCRYREQQQQAALFELLLRFHMLEQSCSFFFTLTGWLKHAGAESEKEQPRLRLDVLYRFHSTPNFHLTHFSHVAAAPRCGKRG